MPELQQNIVEIRAAAREVGSRTKIAVFSRDEAVDPVGACVGMKGSRVQAVVQELSGERIDIVPWSADPERFARLALAPAKVARVFSDPATKTIQAIVDEDQLSLAIGRNGQNVRLELPVSLKEAVQGGKVKVPTPDGAVMLSVPKGSSSGKVLRIKGRGFSDRSGTRGDLLVTLMVDLPAEDAELARFVEGWTGGGGNPRAGLGV